MKLLVPKSMHFPKQILVLSAPFRAVVLTVARRALRAEPPVRVLKTRPVLVGTFWLETRVILVASVRSQFWLLDWRSSRGKAFVGQNHVAKSAA